MIIRKRMTGLLLLLVLGFILLAACGSGEEETPSSPGVTATTELILPTPVELVASPRVVATDTPDSASPTAVRPTVTSPVPTFTPSPTDTPLPTATPEPTSYQVQAGDTLLGISEQYGVSIEALALANGAESPDELSLVVGQILQIPLCQVHEVVAGNTLTGIALSCGVALDDLVSANVSRLASLGSLDAIPLGFILTIPGERTNAEEIDCEALPERQQVIEYMPKDGEGLFCLSQKYGISTDTLLRANAERLSSGQEYGQISLLIPPFDGALYTISSEDVEDDIGITDLVEWYEVEISDITDWNGNRVEEPLTVGEQLLIAGANLANGPFRFQLGNG